MSEPDLMAAHKHSSRHRQELERSSVCGCFYCIALFTPDAIQRWLNEGEGTALCPECGIDSVIGSESGFPINPDFLKQMHEYWFSGQ